MKPVASIVAGVLILGLAIVGAPTVARAKSITIYPPQSIQAAVDAASPGDTVRVMPGDYIEPHGNSAAVRITKRLTLLAKSKLPSLKVRILPNPAEPNQRHGILVEPANDGDPDVERVQIKGFTIEGFEKNGIWLRHVDNFKIEGNESINNLENGDYAIWPDQLPDTLPDRRSKLFLVRPDDTQGLQALQTLYPQGVLQEYASAVENHNFYMCFVPPQ